MAGLEPASEGVKVPCLTTWLHPYMEIPIGFEPMILGLQPRAFATWLRYHKLTSAVMDVSPID